MKLKSLKINSLIIIFLLLIILTACRSNPELVFVYPSIFPPEDVEKPYRPDWNFITLDELPNYVLLSKDDSKLLYNYIIDLQTYSKQLLKNLDYYKKSTDYEKLDKNDKSR